MISPHERTTACAIAGSYTKNRWRTWGAWAGSSAEPIPHRYRTFSPPAPSLTNLIILRGQSFAAVDCPRVGYAVSIQIQRIDSVQRDSGTATLTQSRERCAGTTTFVAGAQFGSGTEPVPHRYRTSSLPRTVLDEFRILQGQSFEPVDCRSDVVGG